MKKTFLCFAVLAFALLFSLFGQINVASANVSAGLNNTSDNVIPFAYYKDVEVIKVYPKGTIPSQNMPYDKHNYTGTLYFDANASKTIGNSLYAVYKGTVTCSGVCPVSTKIVETK